MKKAVIFLTAFTSLISFAVDCSQTVDGVKYEWVCPAGETCGNAVKHELSDKITKGQCKRSDGTEHLVSAGPSGGF